MKISLITIVDNVNFGTYLQAYATTLKLEELGNKVCVIDYIRPYLSPMIEVKKNCKNPNWSIMRKIFYAISYLTLEPLMRWNLKRFLKNNVNMSSECKSLDDVKKCACDSEILVTGSDQVWNTTHNYGVDEVFFWKGCNGRKYSYAASIGLEKFPDNQKERIRTLLECYSAISVRESMGISALSDVGINRVIQVIDPTLLLNRDEWLRVSKDSFKKREPYLLVYSVEPKRNMLVRQQAEKIAREKNLKIYVVCPSFKLKKDWGADRIFNFSTVDKFLALFANADFVIASSFHGTAFSLNFNKEFITISSGAFNTRVESLLTLVNLQQRYTVGKMLSSSELQPIDYNSVNKILDEERTKSMDFLKGIK